MRSTGLLIALLVAGTVAWGFWPSYFGPLVHGRAVHPALVHVHAAVFGGWVVLFVLQAWWAATGRLKRHRYLGRWGMGYGLLVIVVGVLVGVGMPARHLRAGQMPTDRAALVMAYNLIDVLVFATLFGAAIAWRRRIDIHQRLMLLSSMALTGAAVGRVLPSGSLAYVAVWIAPFVVLLAHDLLQRRIHPALPAVLPLFALMYFKVPLVAAITGRLG